jgi:hypothetical protein
MTSIASEEFKGKKREKNWDADSAGSAAVDICGKFRSAELLWKDPPRDVE